MMKCFLFLQAILLLSCMNGVSAENEQIDNTLRGALKLRKANNNGARDLQMGMNMMGRKGRRGNGWDRARRNRKGMRKRKGWYYDSFDSYDYGYYGSKSSKSRYPHYKWNDIYPTAADINFLDDNFFDHKFFDDDDCELIHLNETFSVPRAARFLAPDTTPTNMGNPTIIGTVFIWENQQVLEVDGITPIVGTTVSGSCIRTTTSVSGMGTCQLVFDDDDEYTINVAGLLEGPLGSQMGITGGSGGLVGVIGEMDFLPLYEHAGYETPGVGDVFLNATRYEVHADLGLVVCPAQ